MNHENIAQEYMEVHPGARPVTAADVATVIEFFKKHGVHSCSATPADDIVMVEAALKELEAYSRWGLKALRKYRVNGNHEPLNRCMQSISTITGNLFDAAERLPVSDPFGLGR